MAQQYIDGAPIKNYFEWQGRRWRAETNGKVYGGNTRYVNVSTRDGSFTKRGAFVRISFSSKISVGGGYSMEFARAALRSLGFDE